jgi:hypothetical protein
MTAPSRHGRKLKKDILIDTGAVYGTRIIGNAVTAVFVSPASGAVPTEPLCGYQKRGVAYNTQYRALL